jgi:ornithine cyclodeaminase
VLAGTHPGRSHAAEVTVFDSVGFALEDYAALAFMRDAAVELGIGEAVELVAHAPDPKDLFGLLRDAAPRAAHAARGPRLRAAA